MLSSFDRAAKSTVSPTPAHCLNRSDGKSPVTDDTVWIDLNFPTSEEDAETEKTLGIEIPTRAEMRQIEASNRLYQDRGTYYMTAYVATGSDSDANSSSAVTFILAGDRLITVRYGEPKAWSIFLARVDKGDAGCRNGAEILCGLLESIVQVKADVIERIQDEVDKRRAPFSTSRAASRPGAIASMHCCGRSDAKATSRREPRKARHRSTGPHTFSGMPRASVRTSRRSSIASTASTAT